MEDDFKTEVQAIWPDIQEEDWLQFIAARKDEEFIKKSLWGKELRKKHKMNHRLGSRGYFGKRKVWTKENIAEKKARRAEPFSYIPEGRTRDYVRAWATIDEVTGQPSFLSTEIQTLHDTLVSS